MTSAVDPSFPPFPAAPYPAPNGGPDSYAAAAAAIEEPKRRGRPRTVGKAPELAAPYGAEAATQKRRKKEQPALAPTDSIQTVFRTLQAPDMETFAQVYDILRGMPDDGRGRVLAVLNQVLM